MSLGKAYGETHDVEPEEGRGAHGVDVAQRVGCSYGPEPVWIVNDGWEEVDTLDQGYGIVQLVDSRVIRRTRSH